MNSAEKVEIENLPEKYRPLSAWSYWGLSILFAVPIVGLIFLIIFSFSDSNINRRSFARSFFCSLVIALVVIVIIYAIGGAALLASIAANLQ